MLHIQTFGNPYHYYCNDLYRLNWQFENQKIRKSKRKFLNLQWCHKQQQKQHLQPKKKILIIMIATIVYCSIEILFNWTIFFFFLLFRLTTKLLCSVYFFVVVVFIVIIGFCCCCFLLSIKTTTIFCEMFIHWRQQKWKKKKKNSWNTNIWNAYTEKENLKYFR